MGIVIRRSGYVVLWSYLGFFIGYVNSLWLLPYAFRPEEIGLIRLILAVATMFATLASFGGTQVATRFFPYFEESLARRGAFVKLLIGLAIVGVGCFSLFFILFHGKIAALYAEKSPIFVVFLWYIFPLTISIIVYGFLEAFVVVQGHPLVPALTREVYLRVVLTIATIFFLVSVVTLSGFWKIVTVLYCTAPLILIAFGFHFRLFPLSGAMTQIHRPELKELSQFAGFVFLGNASAMVLANIDSVVLSAYSGLTKTGIYTIAMFIAVIIEIPKRSLSQVLIPMVVKANKEGDIASLGVLYKKSSLNQLIVGAAIFLIVWMNIDGIFSLIPNGQIYREGKFVVLLVSIAKLFDMLTGINAEIIGTSRFYKIDLLIFCVISSVGVGLNFLLIPVYGVNGAAFAVLASVVLYNSVRFVFIALAMKIQPFTPKIAVAVICATVTYGIVSLIPSLRSFMADIVVRTSVIGILFGSMIIGLNVSDDISALFERVVRRLRFRT